MRTSRRGLLLGSLAVPAAYALGACGNDGSPSQPNTSLPSAGAKVSGSITVWDFLAEATAKSEDELFRKAFPDVTVQRVHQPAANFNQLVQAALAARKAPDAMILSAGGPVTQFSAGLEKLDDVLTPEMKANLGFGPVMSPKLDVQQGIYGLPLDNVGPLFFYNKALFRQAGLDPEKPPTSWPEFKAAAEALKAAKITPIAAGDKEGLEASTWFWILAPMTMTPQDTLDLANGKTKFNSDKVREVFQLYVDAAKGEWFQPSWRTDSIFAENADYFSTGKAGMCLLISSYLPVFNASLGKDLGVIQAPGLTPGAKPNYLPYGAGLALSVSKQSTNKPAALAWINWRAGLEMQQRDLDTLSAAADVSAVQQARLPSDKRVQPGANAIGVVTDVVKAVQDAPETYPGAQQLWRTPVMNATMTNFGPVVAGQASLDDALNALDAAQQSAG